MRYGPAVSELAMGGLCLDEGSPMFLDEGVSDSWKSGMGTVASNLKAVHKFPWVQRRARGQPLGDEENGTG